MILEKINKPNDIKKLSPIEYNQLADEIRQFLIDKISVTGGHLASNLGVVELTMALHIVFNLPKDKLIWDVGHQSYTHKILTGRKNQFDELRKFVKKIDAPVCDTLMGKGAFDGSDPHYTGMLGMHGTKTSNFGVSECDLLITIGARFSDRVTGNTKKFAKNAKILQFDVDAAEVNKNIHTDASVIGDAAEILKRVNAKLEQSEHTEWMEHIKNYEEKFPMKYRKDVLNGPYIMEKIYEITNGDAIISTDVGQHQMWAAQHYKFKSPRTLLTSGGLGTMGYGLGASIGAKVGCRDKVVINIAGDGCFRMNMNEIATATRYNIPIIEVIFNNHVLGMVRQWQDLFYGQRYSATVLNDQVDFVKVSEGMGAKAYRVADIESFEKALKEAIELNIPCVIECDICKDDKVFPMVAPGAPISEAFDRDDLNKKESAN